MIRSYPLGFSGAAIAAIAMACHEANRAWCEAQGDRSIKPWAEAPTNIKDSAVDGVCFHIENPDAGAQASHDNWLKFKEADGWVYGPVKDAEAKTHPCMVPFAELPVEQQAKDVMFRNIVHSLAPAARVVFP
jgi:hypothetical protein